MKGTSIQITIQAPHPNRRWLAVPAALLALSLALSGGAYASASTGLLDPLAQIDPTKGADPEGGQVYEDVPSGNTFYEFINRITLQGLVGGYPCGGAGEPCVPPENRPYYRPGNDVTRSQMAKFVDQARRQPGIYIDTATDPEPLYSRTTAASGIAVLGDSASGTGVSGYSSSFRGVVGYSSSGTGVYGQSSTSWGVYGRAECSSCRGVVGTSTSGTGVYGEGSSGWAGYFQGNVNVTGTCCGAGAGSVRIDHPSDPANKYLYHSSVESPEMKTIYDGVVTLNGNGEAQVELPEYFEALNKEFRYQFAPIGAPMPNLYIAEKISDNHFKIAGGKAGMEVSWQVTGIRHDRYAEAHRIPVEEEKMGKEKGKYLHPTEWGQPESVGIDYEDRQRAEQMVQQTHEASDRPDITSKPDK